MWCVVLVVRVVCGETWHAENPPVCTFKNASVCTVRTSPCVPATGPHVLDMRACCRYTRRRPDRTHGGVLNVHTGGFSLLSLLLSLSLSLCCSLSFFLSSSLLLSCLSSYMSLSLFFFSFLFSLFSFLLYLLFHLLCLHTQKWRLDQTNNSINEARPCTTRSIESKERAINLSILAMSQPGKFSRVESN